MNKEKMEVCLQNVSKTYLNRDKSLSVLQEISLEFQTGGFFAVLGPSGAGKTTLLNLIGLLDYPDQGRILFNRKDVLSLPEREKAVLRNRSIGFIFQKYHLLSGFSVMENIILPALLFGVSREKAVLMARGLLEKVGLSDRDTHRPNELSGGEQQRVCICRALINQPRLILADEPTGNLDSGNAEKVEDLLESLSREIGATLIVVTHNEFLAKRAHNRVALLDGKIVDFIKETG